MDALKNMQLRLAELVSEINTIQKDIGKIVNNTQGLQAQLTENSLVKAELELLEDDAKVYKLVGPVLMDQDVAEARLNVNKRVEFIKGDLQRQEERMKTLEKKQDQKRSEMREIQAKMQGLAQRLQQQAATRASG
mmetsp:Transcript_8032/g.14568  ORF Transcript_8032/g.14568 Transcript_8032/m.14568 type:complete len:135 (+) Transcript_8032:49-453(+)